MARIYLDHNASTPLEPAARAAMLRCLDEAWGNPSSIHGEGRRARTLLEEARAGVATLVGASPEEIVFTSGGTEADERGLRGLAALGRQRGRLRIVLSRLEHPAVLGAVERLAEEGFTVTWLPPSSDGVIDPASVAAALDASVALVALQGANHEVGTLQPVAEVARLAHAAGALVHSDLVQLAGKQPIDVAALGVDTAAISAHKLGGPKGSGALVVRGVVLPPVAGGHQERERRPGTEHVAGAVGFAAAAACARTDLTPLAARLEEGLLALGARVHGVGQARVGNTVNAAFAGCPGDLLVEALDLAGVAVSTGAACTSGSRSPSPVLLAMGLDKARAAEAVRFSLGQGNSPAEIDTVLALVPGLVARVRAAVSD